MRNIRLAVAALLAIGTASLSFYGTAGAASSPPSGSSPGNPWTDTSYQPRQGDWQPYVLAPSSHTVKPVRVLAAYPRSGAITGSTSAVLGHGGTVRLTDTGGTTASPLLIIDFGKEVAGQVSVQVTGASATRPALHACFSESREEMALSPSQNSGEAAYAPGCDTANIWNGYPGLSYTWDSDSHTLPLAGATLPATVTDPTLRGGFRYLTLFLSSPGYVDIGAVSLHYTAAPLQPDPAAYKGWFLSSDNELNKIWYAGAYTVQVDTGMSDTAKSWPYSTGEADQYNSQIPNADPNQEVIFDGGKRDRDVWQGDLSVQAPVTYLSTGDTGAVDNSLSSLAAQQLPDGYMPAEGLVGPHNTGEERTYGEYVTWFVNNMAVHYLYTGDKAYLDKWYPALVKAMAWLAQQQGSGGLISFAASGSCGHYGYGDCGTETYINALYYRNLQQMATLATAEGKASDAAAYSAQAATVKNAINSQLWDATTGAYRLSVQTPDVYPQDGNATAILTGVASQQQADSALAYLRANDWSTYGSLDVSPQTPNPVISPVYEPMPSGFEATARLTGNDPNELGFDTGLQLTRQFWGWMLSQDPGSTYWEKVAQNGTPQIGQFESLAHGWASAPTVTLTNQVLGVTPTSAGFATYSVVPHPADLSWAQGSVPTSHGGLAVSWTSNPGSFGLKITAPAGTSGEAAVPTFGRQVQVTVDGQLAWDGSKTVGYGAHSDGTFVYVEGLGAGSHVVTGTYTNAVQAAAVVSADPVTLAGAPGSLQHVAVTVTGLAAGELTGTLSVSAPSGWAPEPASVPVSKDSSGRAASASADFYVEVPADAKSGEYPLTFTYSGGGVTAKATATLHVSTTTTLYSFNDGSTDGWQAGANVASVSAVTSFANGPGAPYNSRYALDAASTAVPASTSKTVQVSPAQPINMSGAQTFFAYVDGYGGAPGATGYQATVTLTSGSQTLTKTVPVSNDAWNPVDVDVSSWSGRSDVTGISVSFAAVGSTTPWTMHFQVDDVGWTG
ncbi:MAG TPA: alpha-L-rhamnosidase C-terminal domain-containing protein [Trebonia sp.]